MKRNKDYIPKQIYEKYCDINVKPEFTSSTKKAEITKIRSKYSFNKKKTVGKEDQVGNVKY